MDTNDYAFTIGMDRARDQLKGTRIANRFTPMITGGSFRNAQLLATPCHSNRRSQCKPAWGVSQAFQ